MQFVPRTVLLWEAAQCGGESGLEFFKIQCGLSLEMAHVIHEYTAVSSRLSARSKVRPFRAWSVVAEDPRRCFGLA